MALQHLFSNDSFKKTIVECGLKGEKQTKNIIDCEDDVLFAWNSEGRKLYTYQLKNRGTDHVYQELLPTEPPLFDVSRIAANSTLTKLLLWGKDGISVMDLPRRRGTNDSQMEKQTRCRRLDPIYFDSKSIEIRQVRYHPGSTKDNHVLILTSNNSLRLYCLEDEIVLEQILLSQPKSTFMAQDSFVDFDFCPPTVASDTDDTVQWPLMLLRGNGDVFYMVNTLGSKQHPVLQGPLPMYPAAEDNYGVESCSILVLQTLPNVIVIATCSGVLYHFVMLTSHIKQTNALYSLEAIELELGIQLHEQHDVSYTCPIFLHHDPISKSRYFCSHDTGVHVVSLSFVNQLQQFLDSPRNDINFGDHTIVEYLICTRTNASPISPVCGLTVVPTPPTLLVLLEYGSLVNVNLKLAEFQQEIGFLNNESIYFQDTGPLSSVLKEPFTLHIKHLLEKSKENHQPILKLNKEASLSLQECLDLLGRSVIVLKNQYFCTYDQVKDKIDERVRTLQALKKYQLYEVSNLETKRTELATKAENLAEKYEDIKDKQQTLTARVEQLLVNVLQRDQIESVAEKKMKNELIQVQEKIKSYKKIIADIQETKKYQEFKIEERSQYKNKDIHLADNQIETLKKSLEQTSKEIKAVVDTVNALKKQLNPFNK